MIALSIISEIKDWIDILERVQTFREMPSNP